MMNLDETSRAQQKAAKIAKNESKSSLSESILNGIWSVI